MRPRREARAHVVSPVPRYALSKWNAMAGTPIASRAADWRVPEAAEAVDASLSLDPAGGYEGQGRGNANFMK